MNASYRNAVLVLNINWVPIETKCFEEALGDVYIGRAKILDSDYQFYSFAQWVERCKDAELIDAAKQANRLIIRTRNFQIIKPDVVIMGSHKGGARKNRLRPTKANVLARDDYTCQYCGKKFNKIHLDRDHIIPESHGGPLSWANLVTSCKHCNGKKRDRTPEQAGMRLLRRPWEPKWYQLHLHDMPELWIAILNMKKG